ncbi:MAG: hypothetical protein JXA42_14540 [Anaerolineales bacterium]|nr:hypothetical protein [Anaerolineales bacterium]
MLKSNHSIPLFWLAILSFIMVIMIPALVLASGPTTATLDDPPADRTVGSGCTYSTIAAAIVDANPGDRLLLEGGAAFNENLTIDKSLTILGGYAGCASGSSEPTTIDGGANGRVIFINENLDVTLLNLNITNGAYNYHGAGVYVSLNSYLDGTNLNIYQNDSISFGGGVWLQGGHAAFTNTHIYSNTAASGGGISGDIVYSRNPALYSKESESIFSGEFIANYPTLDLTASEIKGNTASGYGGGAIYSMGITVTLDSTAVLSNTAAEVGGGIRATSGSSLNIINNSVLCYNRATGSFGGAIMAEDSDLDLSDVALCGNYSNMDGGAICLTNSTLDVNGGWTLSSNTAKRHGGAVVVGGSSTANFWAMGYSQVYSNTAQGGNGGAIYSNTTNQLKLYAVNGHQLVFHGNEAGANGGALCADGGAYVDIYGDVNFYRNWTNTGKGGAIYLGKGSTAWLDDHLDKRPALWDNQAKNGNGGAIYAIDSADKVNPGVRLDGVAIGIGGVGNHTLVGSGGGIYLTNSDFSAKNCAFQNNSAAADGGAIAANASTLLITADLVSLNPIRQSEEARVPGAATTTPCDPTTCQCSVLMGNTADVDNDATGYGGAIYTSDSTVEINQTTLYDNQANRGGAIYQNGSGATLVITNSLIYTNSSTGAIGGGIRSNDGEVKLYHTTFANNPSGAALSQGTSSSADVQNSIAWGNYYGFIGPFGTTECNIDQSGNAGNNIDPKFFDPNADDYHLGENSPAIDACDGGSLVDLEGTRRPIRGKYDMGAFEDKIKSFLPLVLKHN